MGDALGRATARERYYTASAEKLELGNAQKRAELLDRAEVKMGWTRLVLNVREALLTLPTVAVQRGIVARDQEAALQALIDAALQRLATRERS